MASSSKKSVDRVAVVHNQSSVRANPKKPKAKPSDPSQRKVVYKGVLDNPQEVSWPNVPLNLQNTILARAVDLITESGISKFLEDRETRARREKNKRRKTELEKRLQAKKQNQADPVVPHSTKRKRNEEDTDITSATNPLEDVAELPSAKKPRVSTSSAEEESHVLSADAASIVVASTNHAEPTPMTVLSEGTATSADGGGVGREPTLPPELWHHVVFGINEVTKRLEEQSQARRHIVSSVGSVQTPDVHVPLALVLVCLADVNPRLLVSHIPPLVAACNSRPKASPGLDVVHLVPLPRHSETQLADAFGVRRLSIIAFDAQTPALSSLLAFLTSVDPPHAPWLAAAPSLPEGSVAAHDRAAISNAGHKTPYIPTKVKQIKTTAPKDAKLAKEMRVKGRAEAKSKKAAKVDERVPRRVIIKSKAQTETTSESR